MALENVVKRSQTLDLWSLITGYLVNSQPPSTGILCSHRLCTEDVALQQRTLSVPACPLSGFNPKIATNKYNLQAGSAERWPGLNGPINVNSVCLVH